jgi:peptidoglycan/xylan/chitin deacetylase (PgdA/CDA1 family)
MIFLVIIIFLVLIIYYMFFSPSSQLFGRVIYKLHKSETKKKIALTFDDGPNQPYTNQLLEILRKHQVKAIFFVCGVCVEKHPGTLKKIKSAGHAIGNHSHRHKFRDYFSNSNYIKSLELTNSIIFNELGENPRFYRSPWLFRTPKILEAVKSLGLKPIWGVFGCELEIFQPSPEFIARRAMRKAKNGSILIFHDGKESVGSYRGSTIKAIDILIPTLKNRGFKFVEIK